MKPRHVVDLILWGAAAAALILLGLPIAALILRGMMGRGWEGQSGATVTTAVLLSLFTTTLTSLIVIGVGTPLAYLLARRRFPLRGAVLLLVELPVVLPPAVAGIALLLAFGRRGMLGGILSTFGISLSFTTAAVVVAQTFVAMPFYVRAAMVGFSGIPPEVEDAGRVDGAAGWTLFRHVTLPLAARALGAGFSLSWARSMGEFGATILFAGNFAGRTQTLSLLVYSAFEQNLDAAVWAGVILVGLAIATLIISRALAGREPVTE